MRNDVCRRKSVEINHEQAMQCVRLLQLRVDPSFRLEMHGLNFGLRPPAESVAKSFMPIIMHPLEAVGWFAPRTWTPSTNHRRANQAIRNIIRTVFQDQLDWTCSKLPDLDKLSELVGVMGPDNWIIGRDGESIIVGDFVPDGSEYPEDVFALTKDVHLSSGLLAAQVDRLRKTDNKSPVRIMMTCEAIVRLNRFLPHLIRLAGGKVKYL